MLLNCSNRITRSSPLMAWFLSCFLICPILVQSKRVHARTPDSALPSIELLHVWSTENELSALAALKHASIGAGATWSDYSTGNNMVGLQAEFTERAAIGAPPNIVQWIMSAEMKNLVDSGVFKLVDDDNQYYKNNLLPEIYDVIAMEGGLAGIPLGIHVQNHIAYNQDILKRFSLEQANSWQQLVSYGETLQREGIALIAVSDSPWQLRTLFISILASLLSVEEFNIFQTERLPLTQIEGEIEEALSIFYDLRRYANNNTYNLHWQKATMLVDSGGALVQVLGDFIAPEFKNSNISCDITPQAKYPIWGVDSIALVNTDDPDLIAGQSLFLKQGFTPEVVASYIEKKGGLSVFKHINTLNMSKCSRTVFEKWTEAEQRVWIGGENWLKRLAVLGEMLNQFWKMPSRDARLSSERLVEAMSGF